MKKIIQTWVCDLRSYSGTQETKSFSLAKDLNTGLKVIVCTEETMLGDLTFTNVNAYSFDIFEEKYRVNLADVFEKSGIKLNEVK